MYKRQIYTVVNTRIANGEAPDVLNIDVFADYQADDLLLPIQDVVSEETYSKMYDAFLEMCIRDRSSTLKRSARNSAPFMIISRL